MIEFEQEDDGRWIAEMIDVPGALAYGNTKQDAENAVLALAREWGGPCLARDYEGEYRLYHKPAPGLHAGRFIISCAWCGATLK